MTTFMNLSIINSRTYFASLNLFLFTSRSTAWNNSSRCAFLMLLYFLSKAGDGGLLNVGFFLMDLRPSLKCEVLE